MKYRLYIDEVGNPDLGSCHDHNHRFLSLTGVILDVEHIQNIVHPQNEILHEKGILDKPLGSFAEEIIKILQGKYYVHQGNVYGKKFL